MKIVVVSDSHGLIEPLKAVKEKHKDADAFIHCGDSELSPDYLEGFAVVQGNNDYFYDYPNELFLTIDDVKVYVTHGHLFIRSKIVQECIRKAINNHCKLAFFGHTHIFEEIRQDGVVCVNPGSMRYNRDMTPPCYAIVYVEDGIIRVDRELVADL